MAGFILFMVFGIVIIGGRGGGSENRVVNIMLNFTVSLLQLSSYTEVIILRECLI